MPPAKKGSKAAKTTARKMAQEIKRAQEDYSPKEKFDASMNEWLKDDGKRLRAELESVNNFISQPLLQDLNNLQVPELQGSNALVQTLDDGRIVTRIGSGINSGQFESMPKGGITAMQHDAFGWGRAYIYAEQEKPKTQKRSRKNKTKTQKKKNTASTN